MAVTPPVPSNPLQSIVAALGVCFQDASDPWKLTNLYLKIAPLAGTAPPKGVRPRAYGSTQHIADRYAPRPFKSCQASNIPYNHGHPVKIRVVSSTTPSDAFMTLTTVLLRTCRGSSPHDLLSPLARSRLAGISRRSKSSSTAAEKPASPSPRTDSPSLKPSEAPKGQGEKAASDPIDVPTQLWYQRLGPVTDAVRWFHKTQQKRPYAVQVATSLTVYLVGDLLAQDIGGEQYDPGRTLRMLTIGAVASIPGYKWYATVHARYEISADQVQVSLPRQSLQLPLPSPFDRDKGGRSANRVHTNLQYILLWNAGNTHRGAAFWRNRQNSEGCAYQHVELGQAVARSHCLQLRIYHAAVSLYVLWRVCGHMADVLILFE